MKHTIIMIVLTACTLAATAKTNVIKTAATNQPAVSKHKPMANVTMDINGEVVSFSKLPLQAVSMYIFDEQGNVAVSGTVSRKHHQVYVKQLQPGLYTIVLKQGNKVGMYGYHTEVVIKGRKAE
jgi:hypothetical protein